MSNLITFYLTASGEKAMLPSIANFCFKYKLNLDFRPILIKVQTYDKEANVFK